MLALWKRLDAFQESVRRSVGRPEYSFYDGPPFATGLPHYGHILAGTIKDIVTRYAACAVFHLLERDVVQCSLSRSYFSFNVVFRRCFSLQIPTHERLLRVAPLWLGYASDALHLCWWRSRSG